MLIVSGPTGLTEHDGGSHPERPARLEAAMAGVEDLHLGRDLLLVSSRPAFRHELSRVHETGYLDELADLAAAGGGDLDPDTYVRADSWEAACRAAGAGLVAVEELQGHENGVAFVAARPPGHHAEADRGMGFCLLNNIAVAAAALVEAGERVLIVDWDVHHGNGTQSIFWNDPRVLYVSTHQSPLYPGTGGIREVGGPLALGKTLNIPLPAGATGDVVRRAIEEVASPVVDEFSPTWVLVSAGFDAHRDDPLADLALSSGDFAEVARLVSDFAPRTGRMVLFLEGGYDLVALRRSVAATLDALLGGIGQIEERTFGGPGMAFLERARADWLEAVSRAELLRPPPGVLS